MTWQFGKARVGDLGAAEPELPQLSQVLEVHPTKAPAGWSFPLDAPFQRRKSDFGTVFVLPRPMVRKTTTHGPDDVWLPSTRVHIVAGQVEAADGFHYSWP